MVNHKIQAPTTIESLHIVICDTICWGPSWEGTWNDGSRMHGCMHHLHYRHPLCGGWCSSFYALENSSRQEFCRILEGSSEEELHDTVTKHHSFTAGASQADQKAQSEHFLDGKQVVGDILIRKL